MNKDKKGVVEGMSLMKGLLFTIIGVVIFLTAAPTLWGLFAGAIKNFSAGATDMPLVSILSVGLLGLIFAGVIIFAIYKMFANHLK